MFGNLFTSSPAVWTGLIAGLVALPILIHLINLVRHKTIEWAAMEFLLKSHRKNRNWVWLKQMLLLLLRIAILLLSLFLLSQVGCENDRISALLGGRTTHHYVIVDDSFSMSDRDSQSSAMDRVRDTARLIVSRARTRNTHRLSLLRSSAFVVDEQTRQFRPEFDIENEVVDSTFVQRTESSLSGLVASNFSENCGRALSTIAEFIDSRDQENAIVYLLSDFREKDWQKDESIAKSLDSLADSSAAVELIRCAKKMHANLSITDLKPIGNVRVAETPLMMEVTVSNPSLDVASKIQVRVSSTVFSRPVTGSTASEAETDDLPTVFVETIQPGQSETRVFPVWFAQPGKHIVTASIGEDAVETDNVRFCVVDVQTKARVLIVDQPSRRQADFLALALNPNNMTGIGSEIQSADFLRNETPESLSRFDVVCLCDVGQIDETAVKNLKQFVASGGGLVCFGGPNTNFSFHNHAFYENGQGLLPVEISDVYDVDDRDDATPPDIVPEKHPMFAPVNDVRNSLLDLVQVKKVLRPSFEWLQNPPADSKVLATVRGNRQMPLVVEGKYGDGRTMMFMTTANSAWNNWMRNATFPPILLLMQNHLAAGNYPHEVDVVGNSIPIIKPTGSVTPDVTLYRPTESEERIESQLRLTQTDIGLTGRLGEFAESTTNRSTSIPGIYELWFRNMDSSSTVDRLAINVDYTEGDLRIVDDENLTQLFGDSASLTDWDRFSPEPARKAVSSLNRLLLIVLVLVVIAEQTLAWMCSYH